MGNITGIICKAITITTEKGKARSTKPDILREDSLLFIATYFLFKRSAVLLPLAVVLSPSHLLFFRFYPAQFDPQIKE